VCRTTSRPATASCRLHASYRQIGATGKHAGGLSEGFGARTGPVRHWVGRECVQSLRRPLSVRLDGIPFRSALPPTQAACSGHRKFVPR
jgi:hypothetical protein